MLIMTGQYRRHIKIEILLLNSDFIGNGLTWPVIYLIISKCTSWAGFLRVFRFPLPIFIAPISPQSSSPIIRGWYNRPVVAAVPKVSPHKLKQKSAASNRGGPGSNPGVVMWDFVMDKSGAGAGFLRELCLPCQSTFHLLLHNHLHYHPSLAQ
jgi:hypothetical protein